MASCSSAAPPSANGPTWSSAFSDKPIIRRGVGGCTLEQLVDFYTPYILLPYQPKKIFVYAGENDIASDKSGAFVAAEFTKLWAMHRQ
jgi:hypothetical protein